MLRLKEPRALSMICGLQEKDQKHCLEQFFVQNLQRKFRASWVCKEKVKSVASGALFHPHPHRTPPKPHPPTPPTMMVVTHTNWRANLLSQVQNKRKPIMKIGLLAHIGTARSRENAVNTSTIRTPKCTKIRGRLPSVCQLPTMYLWGFITCIN